MNRQFLLWRINLAWMALLLVPVLALAQSPYEGIYMGTYQGIGDDGEFALIVNDRGRATLAAYDAVDDKGYIENNIYIRPDGTFRFTTLGGAHIEGQATTGDVSGRYFATGTQGSFIGLRAADDGPLQDAAGLYSGPVSGTGTGPDADIGINGRLYAIIAADGSAFFMMNHGFQNNAGIWPGGFEFGFDLGFGDGFDFDLGFDSPFLFGSGFYPQFPFGPRHGSGHGHFDPLTFGRGSCGPFQPGNWFGWPFNFNLDYSFRLSILGLIDLDFNFDFGLPTCSSFLPWNDFTSPIGDSGGMAQIDPDGVIQASLLDGLELQGLLNPATTSAEGGLYQEHDLINWSGYWSIERHGNSGNLHATKEYTRLTDVNGDGYADIPWQHAITGESAIWLMDGSDMVAELPVKGPLDSIHELHWSANDPTWTARAITDFDGNGDVDALMTNPHTADLMIRLMENQMPVREMYLEEDRYGQYELAGVGDFDGDGAADIIWLERVTGLVIITVRPGGDSAEDILLASRITSEWRLAAVGDLSGDGSDDLVWRNVLTGENAAWQILNTQVVSKVNLMTVADLQWVIQQ